MTPGQSSEWQSNPRGGRPRVDKYLRLIRPMRTKFSDEQLEYIGQALAILGENYSSWSRRVLVNAARNTVLKHERDQS